MRAFLIFCIGILLLVAAKSIWDAFTDSKQIYSDPKYDFYKD